MTNLSEITEKDLIKVANLQGFENKKTDMSHINLIETGKTAIKNYQLGIMGLSPITLDYLKSKYDCKPGLK